MPKKIKCPKCGSKRVFNIETTWSNVDTKCHDCKHKFLK